MFFTTVVPQESGQLPVSRLGDAMRSAGMKPTASEVGNSVQLSPHLWRMEHNDLLISFGAETQNKILIFQRVADVVFF